MDITKDEVRQNSAARDKKGAILTDGIFVLVSFLFSRCHTLFGAHPLAIALLSVLPTHIFPSLIGAVVGSLSLGREGIVLSLTLAISVFLRLAISGGTASEKGSKRVRLCEGALIRLSVSVIGGFILSAYKVLISGFGKAEILYSVVMIFLTPITAFVFMTVFESGFSADDVMTRLRVIISLKGRDEGEVARRCAFFASLLATVFLLSLSLSPFELFGISLSYIFSSALALVVSRKSGPLIGAATTFFAALALSPIHAAALALAALVAGALFSLGIPYALVGGGLALSVFSGAAEGLVGFLSVFPEYVVAAALSYPLLKRIRSDATPEDPRGATESLKDMVGTMALAYQSRYKGRTGELERAFSEAARVIHSHCGARDIGSAVRELVFTELKYAVRIATGLDITDPDGMGDSVAEAIGRLSDEVAKREDHSISEEEVSAVLLGAPCAASVARRLTLLIRRLCDERSAVTCFSEAFSFAAGIVRAAEREDEIERAVDQAEGDRLSEALKRAGLEGGTLCSLGERRRHLIIAGVDPTGSVITDPIIKSSLEELSMRPFGSQEYYRRGSFVLMECTSMPRVRVEHAVSKAACDGGVSGDTVGFTGSTDGKFYALLSDGMGTGEAARDTSVLVSDLFSSLAESGVSPDAAIRLINSVILTREGELSATVDLFELDTLSGDACFLKCGAAVSYVKRDSSIFRIRSRTAPIGLLGSPDAERVSVEVRQGDVIVMLSDGVSPTAEDAPWLLDLISRSDPKDPRALADSIISAASRHTPPRDDMTAVVLRISRT